MWWLATTWRPLVTATVLFSSAPTASTGAARRRTAAAAARARSRATGAAAGSGRRRRGRPSRRSGCGSGGRGSAGRRPAGRAGSMASSSSWAIGSSLRLPLVITSGRPTPAEQQVVQRAVRQHHAELGQPGRDPRRPRGVRHGAGASTIGRRGDVSGVGGGVVERAQLRGRRRGRRPSPRTACRRAPCGGAARRRRRPTVASTREVVAADALDRHDRAGAQRGRPRRASGVVAGRPAPCRPASRHASLRPARRAGVGLGVEAAVGGIVVLGLAGRRTS